MSYVNGETSFHKKAALEANHPNVKFYKSSLYPDSASARFRNFWNSAESEFFFENYVTSQLAQPRGPSALPELTFTRQERKSAVHSHILNSFASSKFTEQGVSSGLTANSIFDVRKISELHSSDAADLGRPFGLFIVPKYRTDLLPEETCAEYAVESEGRGSSSIIPSGARVKISDQTFANTHCNLVTAHMRNASLSGVRSYGGFTTRAALMSDTYFLDSMGECLAKTCALPYVDTSWAGVVYRGDLSRNTIASGDPSVVLDLIYFNYAGCVHSSSPDFNFNSQGFPQGFKNTHETIFPSSISLDPILNKGFVRVHIKMSNSCWDWSEHVRSHFDGLYGLLNMGLAAQGVIWTKDGFCVDLSESVKGVPLCKELYCLKRFNLHLIEPVMEVTKIGDKTVSYSNTYKTADSLLFTLLESQMLVPEALGGSLLGNVVTLHPDRIEALPETTKKFIRLVGESTMRTALQDHFRRTGTRTTAQKRMSTVLTRVCDERVTPALTAMYFSEKEAATNRSIAPPAWMTADQKEIYYRKLKSDEVFRQKMATSNDHTLLSVLAKEGFVPIPSVAELPA